MEGGQWDASRNSGCPAPQVAAGRRGCGLTLLDMLRNVCKHRGEAVECTGNICRVATGSGAERRPGTGAVAHGVGI
eukprot:7380882-Prymnesium_polylepis.1